MAAQRTPTGLATKGRKLWREMTTAVTFNPAELVILEEACRIADRLDTLDDLIRGTREAWLQLRVDDGGTDVQLVVNGPLTEARQQANIMKQLVAALRVPEEQANGTVRRPTKHGARGAYVKTPPAGATITALERARRARGA